MVACMPVQQPPVETALAQLNDGIAAARADRREEVTLPKQTAAWIRDLLEDLAEGRLMRPPSPEDEMTTQQVADLLNVSRPYVVKLIDEGTLPGHRVGTHRRVYTRDVYAYKERTRST